MKCKYYEKNMLERKCHDYYYSHGTKKSGCYCRFAEWKRKKGVCPYDKNIFVRKHQFKKSLKQGQKTL